jgi:hypothetical protein
MRFPKKVKLFFLLFLCIPFYNKASDTNLVSPRNVSLLSVTAGYRCPVNKSGILNSGHGLYFEGGLNAGYFLPNKQHIVVFCGWAWKDRLWTTSFNPVFLGDFRAGFSDNQLSGTDSLIVTNFHDELNNHDKKTISFPSCKTNTFHNSSFYYGISFGLPFRNYHTVLKLYRGTTKSSYSANDRSNTGKEYNFYELRRSMNGIEISLFPGFKRTLKDKFFGTPLFSHLGVLSFYYERINFSASSLYYTDGEQRQTIALKEFVSSSFLKKYKYEDVFGFKISWAIY